MTPHVVFVGQQKNAHAPIRPTKVARYKNWTNCHVVWINFLAQHCRPIKLPEFCKSSDTDIQIHQSYDVLRHNISFPSHSFATHPKTSYTVVMKNFARPQFLQRRNSNSHGCFVQLYITVFSRLLVGNISLCRMQAVKPPEM